MYSIICNCRRAVWKYGKHLGSCDISKNSDSSDSRQEQTWLQDFATVHIGIRHCLGLSGHWPWHLSIYVLVTSSSPSFSTVCALIKTVNVLLMSLLAIFICSCFTFKFHDCGPKIRHPQSQHGVAKQKFAWLVQLFRKSMWCPPISPYPTTDKLTYRWISEICSFVVLGFPDFPINYLRFLAIAFQALILSAPELFLLALLWGSSYPSGSQATNERSIGAHDFSTG